MIFRGALLREFASSALGVFLVLTAITFATQLIRFLGQAAGGTLAVEGVFAMLGFSALSHLAVLLSLTLFISVLMTLSRHYRDSEMVVWFASGVPLTAWIRPVMTFAAPLVLTIAALSMLLSPWAVGKSEEFRRQLDSRDDVSIIAPGVFRESKQSERVYFVEQVDGEEGIVANVFVSATQHGRLGVMVANRGYTELHPNGDRFLVLLDGRRYEGPAGSHEYRITSFQKYSMRVEAYEAKQQTPSTRSMSTLQLVEANTAIARGELVWRVGLPAAAMVLALLAIPLSFVNPRGGRSLNLVFALLVYVTYSNCLSISQAWVAQSRVTLVAGMWAVHLAMLAVLASLLYWRMAVFSWRRLLR